MPARIRQHSTLSSDGEWNWQNVPVEGGVDAWSAFLSGASAIEDAELSLESKDLVDLMARERNRQQNLHLDLIPQLKRLIVLQGASFQEEHSIEDTAVGTPTCDLRRSCARAAAAEALQRAEKLLALPWIPVGVALGYLRGQGRSAKTMPSEEGQLHLDAAYTQRTYGTESSWPLPEELRRGAAALALVHERGQRVYRELCELCGGDGVRTLDRLMAESISVAAHQYVDIGEHRPAFARCLHRLVAAFGFRDLFDDAVVCVDEARREAIAKALAEVHVCRGRRVHAGSATVLAATRTLRQNWYIGPVEVDRRSKSYMLQKYGPALHWPAFDNERLREYRAFLYHLTMGHHADDIYKVQSDHGGTRPSMPATRAAGAASAGSLSKGSLPALIGIVTGARSRPPITNDLGPELHQEYVRRCHQELATKVKVVDLGVIAGPAPCTHACLWLAIGAAIRNLDLSLASDVPLRNKLSPLMPALRAVPISTLQREGWRSLGETRYLQLHML